MLGRWKVCHKTICSSVIPYFFLFEPFNNAANLCIKVLDKDRTMCCHIHRKRNVKDAQLVFIGHYVSAVGFCLSTSHHRR